MKTEKKKNKEKTSKKQLAAYGVQVIIGAVFGIGLIEFVEYRFNHVFPAWIILASLVVSAYIHIILHEGGHLVCGLISGYKFVSFRISRFIWVKQDEKIHLKRFNLPGTGGQCLMDPPDMEDGKFPATLYNLGGGLSNLFFAAIGGVFAAKASSNYAGAIFIAFAAAGLILALSNLIPLKLGGIANDGYNIISFKKNPHSGRALWIQLRVNSLQTAGMRLRELGDAYFELPEEAAEGDPLMDGIRVFSFQRQIDCQDFEGARLSGERLLKQKDLLGLYKSQIQCEMLFLEVIGPCRPEEVDRLYTKELKAFFKSIKGYPSAWRQQYAYWALFSHDEEAAGKAKKTFEKVLKTYPTSGEIKTERDLMTLVENLHRAQKEAR